ESAWPPTGTADRQCNRPGGQRAPGTRRPGPRPKPQLALTRGRVSSYDNQHGHSPGTRLICPTHPPDGTCLGCIWILPPGDVVPNPKSETRSPKQIQMPNGPRLKTASRVVVWVIPCLVLGVCFGLRVSDFGFPRSVVLPPLPRTTTGYPCACPSKSSWRM